MGHCTGFLTICSAAFGAVFAGISLLRVLDSGGLVSDLIFLNDTDRACYLAACRDNLADILTGLLSGLLLLA